MDRYLHDMFRYFFASPAAINVYTYNICIYIFKTLDSEKATGSLCKSSHADHGHEFGANMANQELTKNPHIFMPYDGCEVFYKR